MTKGVGSNLRGWQPKEKRRDCRTTAGPIAKTTPVLRDAQKPWCGHPRVAGPHLLSGTVGQWSPATGQWWNDPRTDQVTKGADSELLCWATQREHDLTATARGTLETAWVASVRKREGTQEPRRRGAICCCGFVAATVGAQWSDGWGRSTYVLLPSSSTVVRTDAKHRVLLFFHGDESLEHVHRDHGACLDVASWSPILHLPGKSCR